MVHPLAEGEVGVGQVGKELAEGARIHHRAGEVVLAEAGGLLQHGNVQLPEPAPGGLVCLGQPGQLDGTGEPRGPGPDEQHVHFQRLGAGWVAQDQTVEGKAALVTTGQDRGHRESSLGAEA